MLLCGLLGLFGWLSVPGVALAHPLDEYLQATYITVAPTQIVVELNLTPGVLIAPQILSQLDPDGDEQISDAEGQAYVDTMLRNVTLHVDGQPRPLAVTRIDMPAHLNIQAGYGTIRIFTAATLVDGLTGTHQIEYKNNYAPVRSAYQVNAFVDRGVNITLGKQNRDSIQQSMSVDYVIGSAASATAELATVAPAATAATETTAMISETASLATQIELPAGMPEQARQLLAYLYEPMRSPWVLLVALALAGVLGGLHALTPGHGKTLVAAYLVGSRGTVKHAVFLGGIVTFTHTASVIGIGLLALFASQWVVPNVLVPVLEILSGLLVVVLGVRLVWQRWSAFHNGQRPEYPHSHEHSYDHLHDHPHEHDEGHTHAYTHDHGDGHTHTHLPPAEGIRLGNLVAMGVSGGLVPCPEALGIMIIAIGLNRILLGLGLIVSFSFGLAAVLIVLGILLVRSRALVERFGGMGGRWSSALPLASAVLVTVLGVGITLRGLVNYLD
jgi:nickel/cobalt transporter (NicO) family protein